MGGSHNSHHHHKFLSSTTGDELLSNNFDNILSTQEKRQVLFTNHTTSSQKNDVPMSYSSTNSKGCGGYLHSRFNRLNGEFGYWGAIGGGGNSPITITDNNDQQMERFQSDRIQRLSIDTSQHNI